MTGLDRSAAVVSIHAIYTAQIITGKKRAEFTRLLPGGIGGVTTVSTMLVNRCQCPPEDRGIVAVCQITAVVYAQPWRHLQQCDFPGVSPSELVQYARGERNWIYRLDLGDVEVLPAVVPITAFGWTASPQRWRYAPENWRDIIDSIPESEQP